MDKSKQTCATFLVHEHTDIFQNPETRFALSKTLAAAKTIQILEVVEIAHLPCEDLFFATLIFSIACKG